jgi:hypothetical protein
MDDLEKEPGSTADGDGDNTGGAAASDTEGAAAGGADDAKTDEPKTDVAED